MSVHTNAAKCCHCSGKGLIPGIGRWDNWRKCEKCNGTGWGTNVFRILESRQQRDMRFALEEIICWPGRIHAENEEQAKAFTSLLNRSWIIEKVESA